MKICRAMKIPQQTTMNYNALKDFNSHMKVTISYMEFKQIIRANKSRIDYFNPCLQAKYIF